VEKSNFYDISGVCFYFHLCQFGFSLLFKNEQFCKALLLRNQTYARTAVKSSLQKAAKNSSFFLCY